MAGNLRRLTDLMLDEDYADDFLRPTRAAFETAWELLASAEMASPDLPLAGPTPVGDGGILIEWERGERRVFLAVPASPGDGYIYERGPNHRRTIREMSGPALASALEWLVQE